MTPKDKAKELVCKMYGCELNIDLNDIYILNSEGYFLAHSSALIAVDEIINICLPSSEYGGVITNETIEYWQEVKEEINNL